MPLLGSEQMYQALRSLGVDTQLVIYPNQFHGITIPSYKNDRLERYLAWYDKYLKPPPSHDVRSLAASRPGDRLAALQIPSTFAPMHVLADRDRIVRQSLLVEPGRVRVALLRLVRRPIALRRRPCARRACLTSCLSFGFR